jgi:hypothetical protein
MIPCPGRLPAWLLPLLANPASCAFDLSKGADVVVKNSGTSHVSVTRFTEESGVVCYADWTNNGQGTCNLLNLSGSALSYGPDMVVTENSSLYLGISHFSSTMVVMCYADTGNAGRATCTLLTFASGTLNKGEEVVISDTATGVTFISVTQFNQDAGVVCYSDTASSIYGACTCSALFLTQGALSRGDGLVVNSAFASYISVTRHSDSSAVACYSDNGVSSYSRCSMLQLQGSELTQGPDLSLVDTSSSYITAASLSDASGAVCFSNPDNLTEGGNFGVCSTVEILQQSLQAGESVVVNEAATSDLSLAALSENEAILCYLDGGSGNVGTCVPLGNGGADDMQLTVGDRLAVTDGTAKFVSVAGFSPTAGVVCYSGSAEHATCNALWPAPWTTTLTSTESSTTTMHTTTLSSTEFTTTLTDTTTETIQTTSATWAGPVAGLVYGAVELRTASPILFAQDAGARAGVFLAILQMAGVPESFVNFGQSVARTASGRRLAEDLLRVHFEVLVPPGTPAELSAAAVRDRLSSANLTEFGLAVQSQANAHAVGGPYSLSVTEVSTPSVRLIPVSPVTSTSADWEDQATSESNRAAVGAALLLALWAAAL